MGVQELVDGSGNGAGSIVMEDGSMVRFHPTVIISHLVAHFPFIAMTAVWTEWADCALSIAADVYANAVPCVAFTALFWLAFVSMKRSVTGRSNGWNAALRQLAAGDTHASHVTLALRLASASLHQL